MKRVDESKWKWYYFFLLKCKIKSLFWSKWIDKKLPLLQHVDIDYKLIIKNHGFVEEEQADYIQRAASLMLTDQNN